MDAQSELRDISPEVLARVGAAELAYIRAMDRNGRSGYAICSADGELLAIAGTRESAFDLVRRQNLEPVDAH